MIFIALVQNFSHPILHQFGTSCTFRTHPQEQSKDEHNSKQGTGGQYDPE